jgi:hypothetical protein
MMAAVIERVFAQQLDLTSDDVKVIEKVNADEGVRWLLSFHSADRRRSYCLYEAPSPDMLIAAAKRVGIPADAVVEVTRVSPDMCTQHASWLRDWCGRARLHHRVVHEARRLPLRKGVAGHLGARHVLCMDPRSQSRLAVALADDSSRSQWNPSADQSVTCLWRRAPVRDQSARPDSFW